MPNLPIAQHVDRGLTSRANRSTSPSLAPLPLTTAEAMQSSDHWLTLEQAAHYLGFSVTTLRRRCQHRQIRHATDIYGHIRFRREWLDATLTETRVEVIKTTILPLTKKQKSTVADTLRLLKREIS